MEGFMSGLAIRWHAVAGLKRFENQIGALGEKAPHALQRAVARTGDMARTQVVRALTKQTGLKRKVIVRAVKVTRPSFGSLNYVMRTRGGDIALKYFSARETRKGVSASPFGKRKVFAGTFIKAGRFPSRVSLDMGGHVFLRSGKSRFPVEKQKSGVVIPAEMVKGQTAEAFQASVRANLPRRVEHELGRLLK
ncbi:hypothetical protein RZ532_17605 [Nitratireductor aquimarinus]|uniref:phage tail protein n=1 Tax=Nitratireductor aquimarinus TaxID=889300 RepID=UPI0029359554|nr:phage tail protein [Nitratireductor aquimarinus]MDV2967812.1 hypothetical protein [Nitratireductor aquimarinus]